MAVSREPAESSTSDLLMVWEPRLAAWLDEARTLRDGLEVPAPEDGPHALHRQLVQARRALDRVETIVADLIRLRGRSSDAVRSAKARLRRAEDVALQGRTRGFDQYVSARERMAWLTAKTSTEQDDLLNVETFDARVATVLDEARLLYRGVDAVRRDVDSRMRLMSIETRLEH